jgi:hypothetical protein
MSTKTASSNKNAPRANTEETEAPASKPLAATLLQEFQNLKDKFKNEDDTTEKGFFCFEMSFSLQSAVRRANLLFLSMQNISFLDIGFIFR